MQAEQSPLWLAHSRRHIPRYGVCLPGVGLIPGQGKAALVRLSRALMVDMVVCLAAGYISG